MHRTVETTGTVDYCVCTCTRFTLAVLVTLQQTFLQYVTFIILLQYVIPTFVKLSRIPVLL